MADFASHLLVMCLAIFCGITLEHRRYGLALCAGVAASLVLRWFALTAG